MPAPVPPSPPLATPAHSAPLSGKPFPGLCYIDVDKTAWSINMKTRSREAALQGLLVTGANENAAIAAVPAEAQTRACN